MPSCAYKVKNVRNKMKSDGQDSPYSWVVAMAAFSVFFLLVGMGKISGLLFVATMSFYNLDRKTASFPYVLALTMRFLSGPFAGLLARYTGIRVVVFLGCCLSFIGVGLCFFAPNISMVVVFFGVSNGIGCGFATAVLHKLMSLYFCKHINKVIGLTYAGASLSGFVLPPITENLLRIYGLPGTYLVLSGFILHTFASTILLKNPNFKQTTCKSDDNCRKIAEDKKNINVTGLIYRKTSTNYSRTITDSKGLHTKTTDKSFNSQTKVDLALDKVMKVVEVTKEKSTKVKEETEESIEKLPKTTNSVLLGVFHQTGDSGFDPKVNNTEFANPFLTTALHSSNNSLPEFDLRCMKTIDKESSLSSEGSGKIFTLDNKVNHYTMSVSAGNDTEIPDTCSNTTDKEQNETASCLHDLSIFWDPVYICTSLIFTFVVLFINITQMVLVDHGTDIGISIKLSTYLLMAFSIFDTMGGVAIGCIIDSCDNISKTTFSAFCCFTSAVGFVLLVVSANYAVIVLASIIEGCSLGAMYTISVGLILDYIDKDKLTLALAARGWLMIPLTCTTSPIIGYFRDSGGSYNYMLCLMGALSISCSVLSLCIPRIVKCRKKIFSTNKL